MSQIVNPLTVRWANERVRTICNNVMQLKYVIDAYVADYGTIGLNAAIVAEVASGIVVDGSSYDGRTPITGVDIQNLQAALLQMQTALNTTLVSGVGNPVAIIVGKIQTTGSPR